MSDLSPVDEAALSARRQSQIAISKVLFDSVITTSPVVDRASSWLLVGIGTSITLLIGNVESTAEFLGAATFKLILSGLLIGALLGVAEKAMAAMVQTQIHISQRLENDLPRISESHNDRIEAVQRAAEATGEEVDTEIDFAAPLRELESVVPWYNKRKFKRQLKEGLADPLHGKKYAARLYNRQVVYAVAEAAIAACVITLVAWSL